MDLLAKVTNKWSSLPGMDIPLHTALDEIEEERLWRTQGLAFFSWPIRTYDLVNAFFRDASWPLLLTLASGLLLAMWLIDALPSLFRLRWTQSPKLCELPEGVKRSMIRGSEGKLELLIAESPAEKKTKPAILFIHGGFGSASIWLPWMKYLHSNSYGGNTYALSLRGHGASFAPNFLEMAYLTSMTTLSLDIAVALKEIVSLESAAGNSAGVIIAAHSAGGGLVQHALASGKLPLKATLSKIGGLQGLALITAIPPFGAVGVYFNWFLSDPFIWVRTYLHFGHPRSPLASTAAVRRAFFSSALPLNDVEKFETAMPKYESLIWPSQMCFGRFVDVDDILARMRGKHILIMAADGDRLMGVSGQRKMAREYANVLRAEDMESAFTNVHDVRIEAEGTVAGEKHESGMVGSLQLNLVRGSGHHLMNDVKREEAAEVFRKWADGI
jgi:pimeloyl-ACP methyl ester carboxylesterase